MLHGHQELRRLAHSGRRGSSTLEHLVLIQYSILEQFAHFRLFFSRAIQDEGSISDLFTVLLDMPHCYSMFNKLPKIAEAVIL